MKHRVDSNAIDNQLVENLKWKAPTWRSPKLIKGKLIHLGMALNTSDASQSPLIYFSGQVREQLCRSDLFKQRSAQVWRSYEPDGDEQGDNIFISSLNFAGN